MHPTKETSPIDPVIYGEEDIVKSETNDFDMSASNHMSVQGDIHVTSSPSGSIPSVSPLPITGNGGQLIQPDDKDNLDIEFDIDLNRDDLEEVNNPSPTTILFFEMMQEFPDLSSFVCHPDFNAFARIWLEYQRHIFIAQHAEYREEVSNKLVNLALQVHLCLATIVRVSPDRNEEAAAMFSAFRRIKDRIEIMCSVINIVENGRKLGQSPLEAIAPLVDQADEIQRNIEYFEQEQNVIPIVNQDTNMVELKDPNQVSMNNLSSQLVSTYNMMPYNSDPAAFVLDGAMPIPLDTVIPSSFDTTMPTDFQDTSMSFSFDTAMPIPFDNAPVTDSIMYESLSDFQTPLSFEDHTIMPNENSQGDLTSFQPVDDYSVVGSGYSTPAFYIPIHNNVHAFGYETPATQSSSTTTPSHQPVLFSHIEPSWIHSPQINWSSGPVTPEHSSQKCLSYASSPTCAHQEALQEEHATEEATAATILASCNTSDDELSFSSPTCDTLSSVSHISQSEDEDSDDQEQDDEEEEDGELDEDSVALSSQDEEYSQLSDIEDDEDEWITPTPMKKKHPQPNAVTTTTAATANTTSNRRCRKSGPTTRDLRKRITLTSAQKSRRTATSYDAKTTHYLKTIFFDIYSTKDKLTKDQRRKVQVETGLKPRNITYWFSNHKRRFQHSLNVFKKTVQDSQGKVKTYDDFLVYRRKNGLPEEVQDTEFLDDKSIDF